jgi:hypothetical protein
MGADQGGVLVATASAAEADGVGGRRCSRARTVLSCDSCDRSDQRMSKCVAGGRYGDSRVDKVRRDQFGQRSLDRLFGRFEKCRQKVGAEV